MVCSQCRVVQKKLVNREMHAIYSSTDAVGEVGVQRYGYVETGFSPTLSTLVRQSLLLLFRRENEGNMRHSKLLRS